MIRNTSFWKTKQSRNFLASLSFSVWSAITSLAVIPLLIRFLGVEAYGLIGLYASAQGILVILDLGLAPAVNRQVARNQAQDRAIESATLLHTLSPIYWTLALLIGLSFIVLAPFITRHWLTFEGLSAEEVTISLSLLGLVIASRWPAALYQNVLMGAQRQTITSAIGICTVTMANGGGVLLVAFVSSTCEAFFMWQLLCAVFYTQVMRLSAWRVIGHRKNTGRDTRVIKTIWRFTAGMAGVTITGVVLMQLDKLILSKMLSLEHFSRYAIASALAGGLYILLTPTFNNIYPKLSALMATGGTSALEKSYRATTRLFCCILFSITFGGAFFSYEVLVIFTRDQELAAEVAPTLALMLMGTSVNGAMHFPYALQLAAGASRLALINNIVLLSIFLPLVIAMTSRFGLIGGAASWFILNCIYLFFGTWLTHRFILRGLGARWLTHDVLLPFCLSLALVNIGNNWIDHTAHNALTLLIIGGLVSMLSIMLCCIIVLPKQTLRIAERALNQLRNHQSRN